jgi:hypothetical protein
MVYAAGFIHTMIMHLHATIACSSFGSNYAPYVLHPITLAACSPSMHDLPPSLPRHFFLCITHITAQSQMSADERKEERKRHPFGRPNPVRPPARPFVPDEAKELGLVLTRVPGIDGQVGGPVCMVWVSGAG